MHKFNFSIINRFLFTIVLSAGLQATALAATLSFNFTGAVQTYTVPAGVSSIDVSAIGADGGNGSGSNGGGGANITASIPVTSGDVLNIIVGQSGGIGTSTVWAAGGGGGTGIYNATTSQVLIAAGGGGGGDNTSFTAGLGGATTENGSNGSSTDAGIGGINGLGGNAGTSDFAGGGAGVLGNGLNPIAPSLAKGLGGSLGIPTGGAGGSASNTGFGGIGGYGFGGGGGAGTNTAGGGGGYSGGGAAGNSSNSGANAGGGGSFVTVSATSSNLIAGGDGTGTGSNGSLTIIEVFAPVGGGSEAIPTLSQWGVLILILGLLTLSLRRRAK